MPARPPHRGLVDPGRLHLGDRVVQPEQAFLVPVAGPGQLIRECGGRAGNTGLQVAPSGVCRHPAREGLEHRLDLIGGPEHLLFDHQTIACQLRGRDLLVERGERHSRRFALTEETVEDRDGIGCDGVETGIAVRQLLFEERELGDDRDGRADPAVPGGALPRFTDRGAQLLRAGAAPIGTCSTTSSRSGSESCRRSAASARRACGVASTGPAPGSGARARSTSSAGCARRSTPFTCRAGSDR